MNFDHKEDMYNRYDYSFSTEQMTNKLLCTFTTPGDVNSLVSHLSSTYDIMYNKIFILNILNENELVCTYNVDQGNVESMPDNTILVHRKKETNSLYSLNALNELIKKLNGGVENINFPIPWKNYKNCILLTRQGELQQLKTSIKKIVNLSE
jgi:hypothetical protein